MTPPLLVTNLVNIRYLSGVSVTSGVMLLSGKKRFLFVDGRYQEKAKAEANRGIRVFPAETLKDRLKKIRRIRFEAEDATVARLKRWQQNFRGTRFIPTKGVIEEWRRKKTKEEISAIRKACRITDKVLAKVPRMIKVGMSEKELAWEIEKLSHDLGADCMAFETIVAFGPNTSRPHHRPTTKKLQKGEIVQIDTGVKVDGYCSDCSRVFFTAKPTKEQRQVFDLLTKIVKETTKMAKVGASNRSLAAHARKMMKKNTHVMLSGVRAKRARSRSTKTLDQYFLHSLGHGVGLEIHEGLNISSKAKKTKLLLNEVVTTEPGVYFEGKWGMRMEDTVLVTRKGGERMMKAKY